jgi:Protein of unknown function (DUF616)
VANVAVLTACFGGFDQIRAQAEQDIAVDWICVTDDADLDIPAPWRPVVEPLIGDPRLAAKRPKMMPWGQVSHDHVIWIDASMEIVASDFAREALSSIREGLAVHRHPRRDCIYGEAAASLGSESQGGKYDGQPINEQVEHYRVEGHPEHAGLYACGTIAWDLRNSNSRILGQQWFADCERWSVQDQLSFPVVCARLGVMPGVFPLPQLEPACRGSDYIGNNWLHIHPHLK